jgi:hypothetical protein
MYVSGGIQQHVDLAGSFGGFIDCGGIEHIQFEGFRNAGSLQLGE